MIALDVALPDEAATLAFGAALAPGTPQGGIVTLHGDLGAGKTTLVRGWLRGLGFDGRVKSPTYAVVEPYALSRLVFHHLDLYRIESDAEFDERGLGECFDGGAVCAVEWPERAPDALPAADLAIELRHADHDTRRARVEARSERGRAWLIACRDAWAETSPGSATRAGSA